MTGMEITLVVIGVIFLLGSFFVQDKLAATDMKQIAKVSEKEINMILDKQMQDAAVAIEDKVDLAVEQSYDATRRALEKETNEKLAAIQQYSDTVIESVNKSHNEVMFLYSMLNDKHKELTNLATELSEFSNDMKRREDAMLERVESALNAATPILTAQTPLPADYLNTPAGEASAPAAKNAEQPVSAKRKTAAKQAARTQTTKAKSRTTAKKEPEASVPAPAPTASMDLNKAAQPPAAQSDVERSNQEILQLYMNGMSEVDIAKTLGRGLGEIRLVVGLYRGDVVK